MINESMKENSEETSVMKQCVESGKQFLASMRTGFSKDGRWIAFPAAFALGFAFSNVAAVPIALMCYKGAASFKCPPIVFAFLCLVGIMAGGTSGAGNMLLASLAIVAAIFVNMLSDNSNKSHVKHGVQGAIICIAILLIGYSFEGLNASTLCAALANGIVTYTGVFIVRKAGDNLGLTRRPMKTDDTLFYYGVVLIGVLMALPEFSVNLGGIEFAIKLRSILTAWCVFCFSRHCKVSVAVALAAISGILIGVRNGSIVDATLFATAFAAASFLTGIFSMYGYKISVFVFALSLNSLDLLTFNGNTVFSPIETLTILLLCLASEFAWEHGIKKKSYLFTNPTENATHTNLQEHIKMNGLTSERFERLAECMNGIAKIMGEAQENEEHNGFLLSREFSFYIKKINEKVCSKCACCKFCWEKSRCETGGALMLLADYAMSGRSVQIEDVPEKMQRRCNKVAEITRVINHISKTSRCEQMYERRLEQNRVFMQEHIENMALVVTDMADEMKYDVDKNILTKFELEERIDREFGEAVVSIIGDEKGHVEVELLPRDTSNGCFSWDEAALATAISSVLGRKIIFAGKRVNENLSVAARFVEKSTYKVISGVASIGKNYDDFSGDSYIAENVGLGRFLCGISDGMGTGEKAAACSSKAVGLLRDLLECRVDFEQAVHLVNSMNSLTSENDEFATMDACCLDLFDGEATFFKAGATPSFIISMPQIFALSNRNAKYEPGYQNEEIKNECSIEILETDKMPLGLLKQVQTGEDDQGDKIGLTRKAGRKALKRRESQISTINRKLGENDLVILMSDGVYERLLVECDDKEAVMKSVVELVNKHIKSGKHVQLQAAAEAIVELAANQAKHMTNAENEIDYRLTAGAEYTTPSKSMGALSANEDTRQQATKEVGEAMSFRKTGEAGEIGRRSIGTTGLLRTEKEAADEYCSTACIERKNCDDSTVMIFKLWKV